MMTRRDQNLLFLVFVLFPSVRSDEAFEHHLATKTPYRFVANYNVSEIRYDGCTPKKVWGLVRHGTRFPGQDEISDMRTRLPAIRDSILDRFPEGGSDDVGDEILHLLREWQPQVAEEDENLLTTEGERELFSLARRLQSRLPSVLSYNYSNSTYRFRYAISQRTEESCRRFTDGLFGPDVTQTIDFPTPLETDPILEYYKLCTKYQDEVDQNPDAIVEETNFIGDAIMVQTVENVNTRLRFENDELGTNDVRAMYTTCAFETAWNKTKSPWCLILSIDDFNVLEYTEDLDYYWKHGYGYEITYKPACVVMDDLVDFFRNNEETSSLYFTHSGAVVKFLVYLGLYKDEQPLLAGNFARSFDRKFRVSYIDSFANNIFFVLFDCDGHGKILTLHQERAVRLPSCPDSDLCDMETFVGSYAGSPCDFDAICGNTI